MIKLARIISIIVLLIISGRLYSQTNVTATIDASGRTATMSNGIVSLSINSGGQVSSLVYNGKELINGGAKFYLDYTDTASNKAFSPNAIRIERQTDDYAEVVYTNNASLIVLEQGYILRKNVSGIYTYVTVKGTATPLKVREMRIVYRVSPSLFTYGYVSDKMQGELPSVTDMAAVDATPVMDATYQLPNGTIYTKYNWTNYITQDSVHGIMSATEGVWAIPVTHEYVNGGPMKQELTVHTTNKTPLVLQMLQGEHMGASAQTFRTGDQKIYGPFFIYLNSGTSHSDMIADAKQQVPVQKAQWPFQWLTNSLYPLSRATVSGNMKMLPGLFPKGIQVVLAQPGSDIYEQGKQYIYWGLTDNNGHFSIDHVRAGSYTLYAYATEGEVTDELSVANIVVSGTSVSLGDIVWNPSKYEDFLWQIGENDRLSKGYRYSDTIRQYGLYDLPPANLNYTIGTSVSGHDWYYAQTKAGTWTVTFNNQKTYTGNAVLTASIAGAANSPKVDVYINGTKKTTWSFTNDASIYRSAVLGGRHSVQTLTFPASELVTGQNTVQFTISNVGNRGGVMYDCIKLEAGSLFSGSTKPATVINWNTPASIVAGTALGAAQLNATAVGNTSAAVYNPAIGAVLSAGTQILTVRFASDANYEAASKTVSLVVNKGSSIIAWANPAAIKSGTPLSVAQLNATVTGTSGAATYNPAIGTVLPVGTQTLSVTFAGDANYEAASKSVTIEVTKSTSVTKLTDTDVSVFPNPVTGGLVVVSLSSYTNDSYLSVTTLNGSIVRSKLFDSKTMEMDLKPLPDGIYIFRIVTPNGVVVKKIVKN